jgi:cobalamin biosynthesis Co2+ chelatase CbiK
VAAHKLTPAQQKLILDRLALELRRQPRNAIKEVQAYMIEHHNLSLSRPTLAYYRKTYAAAIADIQSQQEQRAAQKRFVRLVCPSPDLLPIA